MSLCPADITQIALFEYHSLFLLLLEDNKEQKSSVQKQKCADHQRRQRHQARERWIVPERVEAGQLSGKMFTRELAKTKPFHKATTPYL